MKQVHAANHMRHALKRIIEHAGKVVARRHVLAAQNGISPILRKRLDHAGLAARSRAGLAP